MPIRVVFMGSPSFSLPSLRALYAQYEIAGVVTQPDKPAGRGRVLTPPPVKLLAEELGLAVIQPRRLKEPEALAQLNAWRPDLIVVVAFGQILRPDVLNLPPYGCINVHGSLLPRWRGAAPIQATILAGDTETGVTIMRMDPGVDTGDILAQTAIPIQPDDTTGTLSDRLSVLGAGLLAETLPGFINGSIQPHLQDPALATHAPMIKKEDGELDFSQDAATLARRVRAYSPWPGTYTTWNGQFLKIRKAHGLPTDSTIPGKTGIIDGLPAIGTADGWFVMDEVQPAGKRNLTGVEFLRGARGWAEK